ncbi:transcriptional repressor [Tepiditoga spiralis]|uniref:Transcriptional repressor n=1 Tax=Tepiditoga spiralis TaxID=2108365 RepID=A0A7G1G7G8_9BACT|nr:transcriptional repressor [Tepiditoga spiralis]BBE30823.1 transcriptional repressor [Tepiditoga spiralis]
MKLTKIRIELLNIFKNLNYPLSAEQIYEKVHERCNLSTIYRNLSYFEDKKIIRSMVFSDKIKYYYSGVGHFHFVYCNVCKNFEKINLCYEKEFENYLKNTLEFSVSDHVLYFEGVCKKCKNQKKL